jgi:hypothetical protein
MESELSGMEFAAATSGSGAQKESITARPIDVAQLRVNYGFVAPDKVRNPAQINPTELDRLGSDISKRKIVPEQDLQNPETQQLAALLTELQATRKKTPGPLTDYDYHAIATMLSPENRGVVTKMLGFIDRTTNTPEERRQLFNEFYTGNRGYSSSITPSPWYSKVAEYIYRNEEQLKQKLPEQDQQYWELWARIASDDRQNQELTDFLFRNQDQAARYTRQDTEYEKPVTRLTLAAVADGLQYLNAVPKYVEESLQPSEMTLGFCDAVLNLSVCPAELIPLSYAVRRVGEYEKEQVAKFLLTHGADFLKQEKPDWKLLVDNLAGAQEATLLNNVTRETEILSTLPPGDQQKWKSWNQLIEALPREMQRDANVAIISLGLFKAEPGVFIGTEKPAVGVLVRRMLRGHAHYVNEILRDRNFLSTLDPAEQQFWQKWKALPYDVRQSLEDYVWNAEQSVLDRLDNVVAIIPRLRTSPSKEIQKFSQQILGQLMQSPNPEVAFEQIHSVFVLNNLPEVGKIYRVFEILHPVAEIDKKINDRKVNAQNGQAQLSPVFVEAGNRRRYDMVYRDLLKVHIDSANPSLYRYLKILQEGQGLVDKVNASGVAALSTQESSQMQRFLNRMDMLYANSAYGRRKGEQESRPVEVMARIQQLRQSFGLSDDMKLTDRVAQMFVRPLGYQNVDQVIHHMDQVRHQAHNRNVDFYQKAVSENGGKLSIQAGDLLKGVREQYLELFFQNGAVAKEYLGHAATSDTTPFDTDVSRVLPGHINGRYADIIDQSLVANYGDLVMVFRDRGQFQETQPGRGDQYTPGKYELFQSGYHGARHFGVRTGMASTEIDAMVVKGKLAEDKVAQQRIFFDIAQAGFYIPVTDKDGQILFTPEDFQKYRINNEKAAAVFHESEFKPTALLRVLEESPYMNTLYKSDSGVKERYSLEQHTGMVMNQFEKYFADSWSSPLISRNHMRMILALHDLGKPLAKQVTGSTADQHEYTLKFVPPILEGMNFGEKEAEIVTAMIDQDFLGEFFQGKKAANVTAQLIKDKAQELGVQTRDLMDIARVFYICDAGSYTTDAGGRASLDKLFTFQSADGVVTAQFSPETQARFNTLLQHVYS